MNIRLNQKNHTIKSFVGELVGLTISDFSYEANWLEFIFSSSPLTLQICGFGRVIKDGEILVTTSDYSSRSKEKSAINDEWYNVRKYGSKIVGGTVASAELNSIGDLRITLDNGVIIECLNSNGRPHYTSGKEQWCLFEHSCDCDGAFLSSYNKTYRFTLFDEEIIVKHHTVI